MFIMFKVRFERKKTQEEIELEIEENKINELLGKGKVRMKPSYEYDYLIQALDNIGGFNGLDTKHSILRTKVGEAFTICGNIEDIYKKLEKYGIDKVE